MRSVDLQRTKKRQTRTHASHDDNQVAEVGVCLQNLIRAIDVFLVRSLTDPSLFTLFLITHTS